MRGKRGAALRSWPWGWIVAATLAAWVIATSVPIPPRVALYRAVQGVAAHQCESMTQRATRCRNRIRFGGGVRCYQHRDPVPPLVAGMDRL